MKDRVSTKILNNGATRYGVYDETGKLLRYEYIKLEDEPSTEGDFFNKANMLPDSITAMLGLKMSNPQVADALNVLANVGNLHVWERVQTYSEPVPEVPAGYTLGVVESGLAVTLPSRSTYSANAGIRYGDVIVDNKGVVSVSGTDVLNAYNAKLYDIPTSGSSGTWITSDAKLTELLRGKAIYVGKSVGSNTTTALETVYYVSGDSNVTKAASGNNIIVTFSKLQKVTGYPYTPAIPAGTTTDYLTSTDRNAYTEGTVDNTTITYLGQLGGGARIEVGSYVGTGTYGSSNKTSLTFGFEPNLLLIQVKGSRNEYLFLSVIKSGRFVGFYSSSSGSGAGSYTGEITLSSNTVRWYANSALPQMNDKESTYQYIAIG